MAKETKRFGVSLSKGLLDKFDKKIQNEGYDNRSEAIRDLIRDSFLEEKIADDREVAGTLTIIFDHHTLNLSQKLDDIQHQHHKKIISKLHIHLDHKNCLEVIVLKGKSKTIREIGEQITALRGVKHGKLTFTYSGHK
jgi:CopG family nickel-responsive transcriptional regulator